MRVAAKARRLHCHHMSDEEGCQWQYNNLWIFYLLAFDLPWWSLPKMRKHAFNIFKLHENCTPHSTVKTEHFYVQKTTRQDFPSYTNQKSWTHFPTFPAFDLKWTSWQAVQGAGFPRKNLLWMPVLWFLEKQAKRGCDFVPSSFSSLLERGAHNERLLLLALWTNTFRENNFLWMLTPALGKKHIHSNTHF